MGADSAAANEETGRPHGREQRSAEQRPGGFAGVPPRDRGNESRLALPISQGRHDGQGRRGTVSRAPALRRYGPTVAGGEGRTADGLGLRRYRARAAGCGRKTWRGHRDARLPELVCLESRGRSTSPCTRRDAQRGSGGSRASDETALRQIRFAERGRSKDSMARWPSAPEIPGCSRARVPRS